MPISKYKSIKYRDFLTWLALNWPVGGEILKRVLAYYMANSYKFTYLLYCLLTTITFIIFPINKDNKIGIMNLKVNKLMVLWTATNVL